MRHAIFPVLALVLVLAACGAPTGEQVDLTEVTDSIPDDDVHAGAMKEAMGGGMGGALNTEITVAPEIAAAWSAIRIKVVDSESRDEQEFVVELGQAVELGDSGLTLAAHAFVPDFVMDEGGITSRSADPNNPAVRVLISEDGAVDYEGWLFASMPGIHPYPHPQYRVLLVEGIPAE